MTINAANINTNNSNIEYVDVKLTNLQKLQQLTDETVTAPQYEIDNGNQYINAKTELIAQVMPAEYLNGEYGNARNKWAIKASGDYTIERSSNHSLVQNTLNPVPFLPAVVLFGLSLVSLFLWGKFR
jgi:hypothetical protein